MCLYFFIKSGRVKLAGRKTNLSSYLLQQHASKPTKEKLYYTEPNVLTKLPTLKRGGVIVVVNF